MIKRMLFIGLLGVSLSLHGQVEHQRRNVIVITMDGFRWQEVFNGADSAILFNPKYVKDAGVADWFWHPSEITRRQQLMPFFWQVIAKQGQLYGNRDFNNHFNCSNPYWFSYPGYSEMLVGYVDKRIKYNDPIENYNSTVLEFIDRQPGYSGKVAAFSTWEVLPYILRANTAGLFTNSGDQKATGNTITPREELLNELQEVMKTPHHGKRYDAFTFHYAFEYLKREKPRVMLISFDETDEHAHRGRYDDYLQSAHQTDQMIRGLWEWLQSDDDYKESTTLIITTDHGRGRGHNHSWKNHGRLALGSGQIWCAVIGPDTPPLGEIKTDMQLFQNQIASTIASFLGFEYSNVKPVGKSIQSMRTSPLFSRH